MPNINIDDAYILDNTGKQVDDAVDYALYNSNRNLLDNPWFTVNQRSAGSTSDGYPADRWLKVGNTAATATATANGLVIALNGSGYCDLRNRYSEAEIITPNLGKTATISAMLADGTVFSDQIVLSTTQQNRYLNSEKIRFDLSVSGGVYLVRLVLYDDMTIRAVKLELGSISTLANDAPTDYGEELAKCQRYFFRWNSVGSAVPVGFGWGFQTTYARITIPTPAQMHTPLKSVSYSGGGWYLMGGAVLSVTNITYAYYTGCGVTINAYASVTLNNTYALICNASGSYIDISAEP